MALARVKNWIPGEVLYASDQNGEFNNILNNALALISPLTGNLACGDNDLTGIDELAFTSAGADASAAGRLRRNSTHITWHNGTSASNLDAQTGSKVVTFTRDLTTASGTQAVTGVGFTPKSVTFFAAVASGATSNEAMMSWGADDGTTAACVYNEGTTAVNMQVSTTASIFMDDVGGDTQSAKVTTLGTDGFTVTWTKAGSPTGTATIVATAHR